MSHKCSAAEREISKKWGAAHGYKGAIGGWVYDPEGNPVAQGWGALFFLIGKENMEKWAKASGIFEEIINAYT